MNNIEINKLKSIIDFYKDKHKLINNYESEIEDLTLKVKNSIIEIKNKRKEEQKYLNHLYEKYGELELNKILEKINK